MVTPHNARKPYLNGYNVELEGKVLRPNSVYEHRDTGSFDPTKDAPPHPQKWIDTFFDDLEFLADPTGCGEITDVFNIFPVMLKQYAKPIQIGDKKFKSMREAADFLGKPPATLRKFVRDKRFDVLEKWFDNKKDL
jgi:hypothetical protein